jgi:hypothetical protein
MDTSTRTTSSHSSTGTRHGWAKKAAAVTVLGLAAALSVTACSTSPAPAPVHVAAPVTQQSQPSALTAHQAAPANPGSQPDANAGETAQNIADYLVSTQFQAGDGTTATDASCDPATVSDPPSVTIPTTVSCDITYSDGSIWQQTVTITYDSAGNPATVSTDNGTELTPGANG